MATALTTLEDQLKRLAAKNLSKESIAYGEIFATIIKNGGAASLSSSIGSAARNYCEMQWISANKTWINTATDDILKASREKLANIHKQCDQTVGQILKDRCAAVYANIPDSWKIYVPGKEWADQFFTAPTSNETATPPCATIEFEDMTKLKTDTIAKLDSLQTTLENTTGILFLIGAIIASFQAYYSWCQTSQLLEDIRTNYPAKRQELDDIKGLLDTAQTTLDMLVALDSPSRDIITLNLTTAFYNLQQSQGRLAVLAKWVVKKITKVRTAKTSHNVQAGLNAVQALTTYFSGVGMVATLGYRLTMAATTLHAANAVVHVGASWKCGNVLADLDKLNTDCQARYQQIGSVQQAMILYLDWLKLKAVQ